MVAWWVAGEPEWAVWRVDARRGGGGWAAVLDARASNGAAQGGHVNARPHMPRASTSSQARRQQHLLTRWACILGQLLCNMVYTHKRKPKGSSRAPQLGSERLPWVQSLGGAGCRRLPHCLATSCTLR